MFNDEISEAEAMNLFQMLDFEDKVRIIERMVYFLEQEKYVISSNRAKLIVVDFNKAFRA